MPLTAKSSIKYLAIPLIFISGMLLIYLAAYYYLKEEPSQIIIAPEENQQEPAEIKKIDYPAPEFELQNLNGENVKLSDFKGKIIILNFWTTWNPAAQDQVVILDSYFQDIKGKENITLLTVNNLENKSAVLNFISRGEYALPVLLDKDGKIGELYGINSLPETFFIDQQGVVKEIFSGVLSKEEVQSKVEGLYTK
jgi:peroxiredoxin